MGLHHNREKISTSWIPQHHSLIVRVPPFQMRMMHLDHHAQLASHFHHTCGICSKAHMRMFLTMGDRGRAYVIILSLTYGIHTLLIHLETHEDVIVSPHPLGDTTFDFIGYKGTTPLITIFGAYSITLSHFEHHQASSMAQQLIVSTIFFLLKGLPCIMELSWWACHQVMSLLYIILLFEAQLGIIRKIKLFRKDTN